MNLTYLILGSNSTDKEDILVRAIALLEERLGKVSGKSSIYETAAWGYHSENVYHNQVLILETTHSTLETLHITQKIEKQLGRTRKSIKGSYADRPIDIDILFYATKVVNLPELTIPHPHICVRRFVLEPLCEVIPDFSHPTKGKTISQLLEICEDTLAVKKL